LAEPGKLTAVKIQFTDDPEVPFPFRGRSVTVKVAAEPKPLVLSNGEKALAQTERGPVWVFAPDNATKHFRSAMPLPAIAAEGSLFDVLNGDRFVELLPLLHFLRFVSGDAKY